MTTQTAMAFDVGAVRVGVAYGNTMLREATPLAVLPALPKALCFNGIEALLKTWQPDVLVVGVARHASGEPSPMTARCERFANQLSGRFGLPVTRIDERYSSLDAEQLQRVARQHGGRSREHQDDLAAAVILKRYFEEGHVNAS